ncbi:MAG: hypothetical protein ACR2F5_04680 [Candidatus Limnocylindria bacterium]
MERLRYRSTSTTDLLVELRQRALLDEVGQRRHDPLPPRRTTFLGLPFLRRRR